MQIIKYEWRYRLWKKQNKHDLLTLYSSSGPSCFQIRRKDMKILQILVKINNFASNFKGHVKNSRTIKGSSL